MTKPSQWNDSLLNLNGAMPPHASASWRGKIKKQTSPCESCELLMLGTGSPEASKPQGWSGRPCFLFSMAVVALGAGQKMPVFIENSLKHQGCPLSPHAGMSENWKPVVAHPDWLPRLGECGSSACFPPACPGVRGCPSLTDGVNAYYTTSSFVA